MIFSHVFWGSILILLGLNVIIKGIFGVSIPFIQLLFGLFILYLGYKVIVSHTRSSELNSTFFTSQTFTTNSFEDNDEYTTILGQNTLDFSSFMPEKTKIIDSVTIFGNTIIKLNPSIPTLIKAQAAFAYIKFPNENSCSFGSYTYRSHDKQEVPLLIINLNGVFGSIQIKK